MYSNGKSVANNRPSAWKPNCRPSTKLRGQSQLASTNFRGIPLTTGAEPCLTFAQLSHCKGGQKEAKSIKEPLLPTSTQEKWQRKRCQLGMSSAEGCAVQTRLTGLTNLP